MENTKEFKNGDVVNWSSHRITRAMVKKSRGGGPFIVLSARRVPEHVLGVGHSQWVKVGKKNPDGVIVPLAGEFSGVLFSEHLKTRKGSARAERRLKYNLPKRYFSEAIRDFSSTLGESDQPWGNLSPNIGDIKVIDEERDGTVRLIYGFGSNIEFFGYFRMPSVENLGEVAIISVEMKHPRHYRENVYQKSVFAAL